MFNLQGSEIIFLVLIALLVLGPEKLPDAIRKFGRVYGEFRKMANGFQGEIRSALDEPMRELQKTADMVRNAANFDAAPTKPVTASVNPAAPAASAAPTTAPATTSTAATTTAPVTGDESVPTAPARPGLNFGDPSARRPVEAAASGTSADAVSDEGSPT